MENSNKVSSELRDLDPLIADALDRETARQQNSIEMIASENLASPAVIEALGHKLSNKALEGYPGSRFHGGAENVDTIEQAAIDRAKEVFGAEYANVQPHSGTQANQAVFFSLVKPGDKILSLDLASGGHLSHGARPNISGRWFEAHHYAVDRETAQLNYDQIAEQANEVKPQLLIAGGSAYPRIIDFERMAKIASDVGAYFLVDMAHVAGLVAAGAYPSPVPHADLVTFTTNKTMGGSKGGVIISRSTDFAKKLQSAIFPGVQGGLQPNMIAAKAVCFQEALQPEYKTYGKNVVENARLLASILSDRGIKVVSGGTDTHMVLLDLSTKGIIGQDAEDALDSAGITSNKNPIPFDVPRPADWVGLRLGSASATTRGFNRAAMTELATCVADLIDAKANGTLEEASGPARKIVADLCQRFPTK